MLVTVTLLLQRVHIQFVYNVYLIFFICASSSSHVTYNAFMAECINISRDWKTQYNTNLSEEYWYIIGCKITLKMKMPCICKSQEPKDLLRVLGKGLAPVTDLASYFQLGWWGALQSNSGQRRSSFHRARYKQGLKSICIA